MQATQEAMLPSLDGNELGVTQALYFKNIGVIQNAVLTGNPDLFISDGETIVEKLEDRLSEYGGPDNDEGFVAWAAETTRPDVEKYKFFYRLIKECREDIRSGIWSLLHKNLDLIDHSSTSFIIDQIEEETFVWAWKHLEDLLVPGTAALPTRLAAQAKFQAMTWRQRRLRERERFDDAPIAGFGDMRFQVNVDSAGGINVGSPLYFDPRHDAEDDENDQPVPRPKDKPVLSPSDSLIAMKSGAPKLLCPAGCGLQPISADAPEDGDAVVLRCGHTRPAFLPVPA
jgi:hypothetical protein